MGGVYPTAYRPGNFVSPGAGFQSTDYSKVVDAPPRLGLFNKWYIAPAAIAVAHPGAVVFEGPKLPVPGWVVPVLLGSELFADILQYLYDASLATAEPPSFYVPDEYSRGNLVEEDLTGETDKIEPVEVHDLPPLVFPAHYGFTQQLTCSVPCDHSCKRSYYAATNAFVKGVCGNNYGGAPTFVNGANVTYYTYCVNANDYSCLPGCSGGAGANPTKIAGQWTRNPGYGGLAYPYGAANVAPASSAIADDGVVDRGATCDLVPYYPTAWDLPVQQPGQRWISVIGWPFALQKAPAVPVTVAKPDAVTDVPPGARTVQAIEQAALRSFASVAFPAVPMPRVRELKVKTLAALKTFKAAYGFVTELKDFVSALWKGLPRCMQRKYGKGGPTIEQMGEDLVNAYGQINADDVKTMLKNVIKNEIQDAAYGQLGKFNSHVSKMAMKPIDTPFGFHSGNAGQGFAAGRGKKTGPRIDLNKINDAVDYAVDNVWGPSETMGKVDKAVRDKKHPGKTKRVEVRCAPGFKLAS